MVNFGAACVLISVFAVCSDVSIAYTVYSERNPLFEVNNQFHYASNINKNMVHLNRDSNLQPKPFDTQPKILEIQRDISFQQPSTNGYLRENHILPRPQSNLPFDHQQNQVLHEQHVLPRPVYGAHQLNSQSGNQSPAISSHTIPAMNQVRPVFEPPHHHMINHQNIFNPPRDSLGGFPPRESLGGLNMFGWFSDHTTSKPGIRIMANNVYINKGDRQNNAAWQSYLDHKFSMIRDPYKPLGQAIKPNFYEAPVSITNTSITENIPKLLMIIMTNIANPLQLEKGMPEEINEKNHATNLGTMNTMKQTEVYQMSSQTASNLGHHGNNLASSSLSAMSEIKQDKAEPNMFHPLLSVVKETPHNASSETQAN